MGKMPSKRRNNGRAKKNKGRSKTVRCQQSGCMVAKDKAIKRFHMRNLVDGSSRRDIKENYAYDQDTFVLPKLYCKMYYSISVAIHSRVVTSFIHWSCRRQGRPFQEIHHQDQ